MNWKQHFEIEEKTKQAFFRSFLILLVIFAYLAVSSAIEGPNHPCLAHNISGPMSNLIYENSDINNTNVNNGIVINDNTNNLNYIHTLNNIGNNSNNNSNNTIVDGVVGLSSAVDMSSEVLLDVISINDSNHSVEQDGSKEWFFHECIPAENFSGFIYCAYDKSKPYLWLTCPGNESVMEPLILSKLWGLRLIYTPIAILTAASLASIFAIIYRLLLINKANKVKVSTEEVPEQKAEDKK